MSRIKLWICTFLCVVITIIFILIQADAVYAACKSEVISASSSGSSCSCKITIDGDSTIRKDLSVAQCNSYCQNRKTCPVCQEDAIEEVMENGKVVKKAIKCVDGHLLCQSCIERNIKTTADISQIKKGMRCIGTCNDRSQCGQVLPFQEVRDLVSDTERVTLDKRVAAHDAAPAPEQIEKEINTLSDLLKEAFTLCCTEIGCGMGLDKIEGCNAATCSNEECKTRFCYLCLEKAEDNKENHDHARGHSNNYWEHRPGYTERYHWLLAREKMDSLFQKRIHPAVMAAFVKNNEKFLKEMKMWPFRFGIRTQDWIKQVNANSELTRADKIELLQNELIYQRNKKKPNKQDITLIDAEIRKLGGRVLASLDVKDEKGIPDPNRAASSSSVPSAAPRIAEAQVAAGGQNNPILPVQEGDANWAHILEGMRNMGRENMYRIHDPQGQVRYDFILSAIAPRKMDHADAVEYCRARGARLPLKEEHEALSRAMGRGQPRGYQRRSIPGMENRWFWSGSVHPDFNNFAYSFNGYSGNVDYYYRNDDYGSVQCVVVVP